MQGRIYKVTGPRPIFFFFEKGLLPRLSLALIFENFDFDDSNFEYLFRKVFLKVAWEIIINLLDRYPKSKSRMSFFDLDSQEGSSKRGFQERLFHPVLSTLASKMYLFVVPWIRVASRPLQEKTALEAQVMLL